jgi:integrase
MLLKRRKIKASVHNVLVCAFVLFIVSSMATVYLNNGSPYWFARFNNRSGKRISRTTRCVDKKEAKLIAASMELDERKAAQADPEIPKMLLRTVEIASLELRQGTLTVQRAEDLIRQMVRAATPDAEDGSFRRFSAAWLDRIEGQAKKGDITASTSNNCREAVKLFNLFVGTKADEPLHKLTTGILEAFQDHLSESRKAATVNGHLSVIRRILESAVDKKLLDSNPAKPIKGRVKSDATQRTGFAVLEVRKLITAAPSKEWRGLITLAAHTGLRCGDLLSLTAENINGTFIEIQTSKTGAIVSIPLTPPCLAWVENRTGDFFPKLKLQKASTTSETFGRIMRDAGIPKVIKTRTGAASRSFHSLRHTFASWLAEADVHSDVRQKLTGHTDAKTHARYSHHDEALVRAVASLPQL